MLFIFQNKCCCLLYYFFCFVLKVTLPVLHWFPWVIIYLSYTFYFGTLEWCVPKLSNRKVCRVSLYSLCYSLTAAWPGGWRQWWVARLQREGFIDTIPIHKSCLYSLPVIRRTPVESCPCFKWCATYVRLGFDTSFRDQFLTASVRTASIIAFDIVSFPEKQEAERVVLLFCRSGCS